MSSEENNKSKIVVKVPDGRTVEFYGNSPEHYDFLLKLFKGEKPALQALESPEVHSKRKYTRRNKHNIKEAGDKKVKCPECKKPVQSAYLPHHIKRVHADKAKNLNICKVCGEFKPTESGLSIHMGRMHPDEWKEKKASSTKKVTQPEKEKEITAEKETTEEVQKLAEEALISRSLRNQELEHRLDDLRDYYKMRLFTKTEIAVPFNWRDDFIDEIIKYGLEHNRLLQYDDGYRFA